MKIVRETKAMTDQCKVRSEASGNGVRLIGNANLVHIPQEPVTKHAVHELTVTGLPKDDLNLETVQVHALITAAFIAWVSAEV